MASFINTVLPANWSDEPTIPNEPANAVDAKDTAEGILSAVEVLVVDSLNTLPAAKEEFFRSLSDLPLPTLRVLLVVVDSDPMHQSAAFWEYLSDVVIRLDRTYERGYMIRTIEVVKARYQQHAWGKHQLKIYEPLENVPEADRMRAHPYREQGGVFIFPSIHYVLSKYKRKGPREFTPDEPEDPVEHLREVVTFPLGECAALVGDRGTHKSHLGYLVLLSRILKANHRGLVVSLRDSEALTRKTMNGILKEQFSDRKAKKGVAGFEAEGKLEIMYYPPGYITPEEFFHRLLLSINRLAAGNAHVTLIFNSLDQLSSRFPLCAKEEIFIPGIVQMLSASGVSSIFVAARDEHRSPQAPEYYTLMSIAEVLASLSRTSTPLDDYVRLVERYYRSGSLIPLEVRERFNKDHFAVGLSVDRYAGGRPAGARGLLELIPADCAADDPLYLSYRRRGLVFLPVETARSRDSAHDSE